MEEGERNPGSFTGAGRRLHHYGRRYLERFENSRENIINGESGHDTGISTAA
jgi:DNA-binding transcriptional LysR family regulator